MFFGCENYNNCRTLLNILNGDLKYFSELRMKNGKEWESLGIRALGYILIKFNLTDLSERRWTVEIW